MVYGPTCPSTVMDSKGLLVGLCMDGHDKPSIRLMDPKTLAVLASIPQPATSQYGVHFYIDPYDRTVISNGDGHILRVSHRQDSSGQWSPRVDDDCDLSRQVSGHCGVPRCDYLVSVKPDWAGRIWFSSLEGVVGTLNPRTGAVRTLHLPDGERVVKAISTSFRGVALGAKLSMSKGIVYNFERTVDDAGVPTYSFMAIDAHTGKTLSRTPLGHHFVYEGLQLNGMLGPDGSYYQGVLGGMIRVSPATG
jgi:hypothetical protein